MRIISAGDNSMEITKFREMKKFLFQQMNNCKCKSSVPEDLGSVELLKVPTEANILL
jgi:hypothetical protein